MLHQRQRIREAAKAALVGKTAVGDRVHETRILPWKKIELPAIAVYTLNEEVDPESARSAPRELERTVELAIEAFVEAGDNVDDALDALALQIERAMHADETLGGTASDSILSSSEMAVLKDGEKLAGTIGLTYSVRYFTYAPDAADVHLNEFATADIRHNLGNVVHPDNEAHDRLTGLDEA